MDIAQPDSPKRHAGTALGPVGPTRRALARKGAKLAFVIPAAVALKVNVASAGIPRVVTGPPN